MKGQARTTWSPTGAAFSALRQTEAKPESMDAAARIADLEERVRLLEWDIHDLMSFIMKNFTRPEKPATPDAGEGPSNLRGFRT